MREDITHFVTRVCQRLKQRKPAVHVNAPLQPIISTAPLQLVYVDFVHLEPSSGGYQYLLGSLTTLQDFNKHTLRVTILLKLPLISCSMTSS